MKQKIFFIIFKGLSATQTKIFFGRWKSDFKTVYSETCINWLCSKAETLLRKRKNACIKFILNRLMSLLTIYNNNNSFVLLWLRIVIIITSFIENKLIYCYVWYFLKSPDNFTLTFIYTLSTLFTFILHPHLYIYISFHQIG